MSVGVFRFTLASEVSLIEAEMTLILAAYAVEGLFGAAVVRLDFHYQLDTKQNAILVDGSHAAGTVVARVFTNLLIREFGEDSFHAERIGPSPTFTHQNAA